MSSNASVSDGGEDQTANSADTAVNGRRNSVEHTRAKAGNSTTKRSIEGDSEIGIDSNSDGLKERVVTTAISAKAGNSRTKTNIEAGNEAGIDSNSDGAAERVNTATISHNSNTINEASGISLDKDTDAETNDSVEAIFGRMVTRRQLLPHETEQLLQLMHDDCLVVSARGLCLERVLAALLHVHRHPGCLVLVLGVAPHETPLLCRQLDTLASSNVSPSISTRSDNNATSQAPQSNIRVLSATDTPPSERRRLYLAGGVLLATARILLLDLLNERCPVDLVTGVVVWRAHRVTEASQEAFILRLFRQKNKTGFIKAFTSSPVAFTAGYNHVERVMRNLFAPQLFLWPRFHLQVRESLSICTPDVVELHVTMTSLMTSIHTSLLDLIGVSVKEFRRLNTSVDCEELTVEAVISRDFSRITSHRLDPVWHRLSARSRQLVADLRSLKQLLAGLLQLDCCAFYQLVAALQKQLATVTSSASTSAVGWTMLEQAETVFVDARRRVFGSAPTNPPPTTKSQAASVKKQVLRLEEPPKSVALMTALREIVADVCALPRKSVPSSSCCGAGEASERAVNVMVFARDMNTCAFLRQVVSDGVVRALWRRYLSCLAGKFGGADVYCVNAPGRSSSAANSVDSSDFKAEFCEEDVGSSMELMLTANTAVSLPGSSSSPAQIRVVFVPLKSANSSSLLTWHLLQQYRPDYLVLHDPDIMTIRCLEVHQAWWPQKSLRVYTLTFAGTVEEQAYLSELRVEKQAFEWLVQQKQQMIVPQDRDGRSQVDTVDQSASSVGGASSRQGGAGVQSSSDRGRVIIDSREFRSELPALLFRRGLDIIPATIEVGDYIVTPDVCVERKSINDLVGSLISGRLYTQTENMVRHYKQPALLIEFDQDKPFNLQGRLYLSSDLNSHQLVSRLVLLTLHFPQLRIMWCPSPLASADLLHQLKQHVPQQPSLALARAVTTDADAAVLEERFNPQIRNFVSKLPGVDSKNLFAVLNKIQTLADLVQMSKDELAAVLGSEWSANRLHEALHSPLTDDFSSSASAVGVKRPAGVSSSASSGTNKSRQRPRFWRNKT